MAFLQGTSAVQQTLALGTGTYYVRFWVAQRNCCSSTNQALSVVVGGVQVGTVQPPNNGTFQQYTSDSFVVDQLTGISPRVGAPGTSLTLTGSNLQGAARVTFTGSGGTKVVSSGFSVNAAGTQITGVVVPAGAQSGLVTVTSSAGLSLAAAGVFFTRARTLAVGVSGSHTVHVRPDGTLWAWGRNDSGQLGNNSTTESRVPLQVGTATNWVSVAASTSHTMGIRADGTLWAWGSNDAGRLGINNSQPIIQLVPMQVGTGTDWVSVTAGQDHTVAVRADGTLWAWGNNSYGQLGYGALRSSSNYTIVPEQVGTDNNWVSAAAGIEYTLAVRTDGSLWAWGRNGSGQMAGTIPPNIGLNVFPLPVGTATTWVSAAAGNAASAGVRTDGTLWTWGNNGYGQLGTGASRSNSRVPPTQVGTGTNWASAATGKDHMVAAQADGTLWAWGNNDNGQLGNNTFTVSTVPVQVGSATSWTSAAAGYAHSAGELSCRALSNWGSNYDGQLGIGANQFTNFPYPVQIYNPMALGSFTPTSAAPGTSVRVTGVSLAGVTGVSVNGASVPLSDISNNTDTEFTFVVPGGATATGSTIVSAGCGQAGWSFTVLPATITAISPGVAAPGAVLTLTGRLQGATQVTFTGSGGTKVVSTGFSMNGAGTQLTGVVVPAGAQSGPVTVTTPAGTSVTAAGVFFTRARTLAAGNSHTVQVRPDGTLWAWGWGGYGQLGTNSQQDGYVPVRAGTATSWVSVAAGAYHTVAVRTDGTLWAWGFDYQGQLGNNSSTPLVPTQVGAATNWVSVAAGEQFTVAVRADGTLWAWGQNNAGQLGINSTTNSNAPVRVGAASNWLSVAAGQYHTVAVRADGTLWAWGQNNAGQLGTNSTTGTLTPVQVSTATTWVSVAAGEQHTVAVRNDGTLWTWGQNSAGQLGINSTTSSLTPVQVGTGTTWVSAAAGAAHTVALRADGTVWAWGQNSAGQLGDGTTTSRNAPVQAGTAASWLNVAAGYAHSAGEWSCRAAWAWGQNSRGQLGNNSTTNSAVPVQAYSPSALLSFSPASALPGASVAVTGTGLSGLTSLSVNGANVPLSSISNSSATGFTFVVPAGAAASGTTIATISAGCGTASSTAFGVLSTLTGISPAFGAPGTVLTLTGTRLTGATQITFTGSGGVNMVSSGFSVNAAGTQLTGVVVPFGAQSGTVTVTTPGGTSVVAAGLFFSRTRTLATGGHNTAQVRADGTLWTWGQNNYGQLGNNSTTDSNSPVQVGSGTNWVSVAVGQGHTVALRADGTLWAWGYNMFGQLGNNSQANSSVPVQVGTATNWVSVSAGPYHSVAIQADGSLWAWGYNNSGQLGNGYRFGSLVPASVAVGSNVIWVSAAAGISHTVAVRADGTLWAWGSNSAGQLGTNTTTDNLTPVQTGTATTWTSATAGGYHSAAVRADGTLWAWGQNNAGQLGINNTANALAPARVGTGSFWLSAAGGEYHTVALRADGALWAWGQNSDGQLGDGTAIQRTAPVQVGTGTSWLSAAASQYHSAGEQSCRAVWAWGFNPYGQLGNGGNSSSKVPVQAYSPVALLSFSPSSALPGASVTVTGTGLAGLTSLSVNGTSVPLGSISSSSATGFTFVVPAGVAASGTTTVSAGCGTASSTAFTLPQPVIASFSPNPAGAGVPVTLTGTGLGGAASLSINGAVATILTNTATTVTFQVPSGATATGTSSLTVPGGTASSTAFAFLAPPGNALAFDGVNDEVRTAAAPTFGTGDFTLEAWVRSGTSSTGTLVAVGSANGSNYWMGLSNQRAAVSVSGTTCMGTTVLTDGRWHHLAGVRSAGTLTIYVDGVAQATVTNALGASPAAPLGIGSFGNANSYWAGSLDEVRLWNVARTPAQLQAVMATPLTGSEAGLVGYYSFDEGTPGGSNPGLTTLYDLSSSAAHGTLTRFDLTGSTSNWVESYSMAVPTATAATALARNSFVANWTSPTLGIVDNGYRVDVSDAADFSTVINGSPFTVSTGTDLTVNGLIANTTYYYRVRADKVSVSGQGGSSNVQAVTTLPCAAPIAIAQDASITLAASGIATVTAAQLNNGSTANCGAAPASALSLQKYATGTISGDVAEGGTLTLTAPNGGVFTAVSFASYGTPTGTAGSYALGSCHASTSAAVASAALLGNTSGSIVANNTTFGDPCGGTPKKLAVTATYEYYSAAASAASLTYTCAETGPHYVQLTVTSANGATSTARANVTVSVPATPTTTWLGGSADWTDCSNWSFGKVPDALTSAVLPAGRPSYPSLLAGTYTVQSLTIASGGSLTLASGATLQVSGDFTNNGTAVLSGTVAFVGNAASQALGGNTATSFATVVINKPSGTVQLTRSLSIGTALTLSSGTLTTGSYLVNLDGAASISESDASYVIGKTVVSRTLDAGSAEPFGGLGLTLTPAVGSVSPGNTKLTRITGVALTGAGTSQSVLRYFDVEPTLNSGLNVAMAFSYFAHELNGIAVSNLALFKSASGGRPWLVQRGTTAAGSTLTKTGITDFSTWTLGNAVNPLPVELTDFTATPEGRAAVRLAWATASEQNSQAFDVERSTNGRDFTALGTVAAAGTSSNVRNYSFLDAQLPVGAAQLYYRLRQLDQDGTSRYSTVRLVSRANATATSLALFPNPTHGAATLTGVPPGANVTVFDAVGRQVLATSADADGKAEVALPSGLAKGVYVVRIGTKALRLTLEE